MAVPPIVPSALTFREELWLLAASTGERARDGIRPMDPPQRVHFACEAASALPGLALALDGDRSRKLAKSAKQLGGEGNKAGRVVQQRRHELRRSARFGFVHARALRRQRSDRDDVACIAKVVTNLTRWPIESASRRTGSAASPGQRERLSSGRQR